MGIKSALSSVNWSGVATLGAKIAGVVVPQIGLVETLAGALPSLHGTAKEDTAVQLAKIAVNDANFTAGKTLLNDPEVEAAVRALIQSYVSLQNVIVKNPDLPAIQTSNAVSSK